MDNVIIWRPGDVIVIGGIALLVIGFLGWWAYACFIDWKNSPRRWWNKRKR